MQHSPAYAKALSEGRVGRPPTYSAEDVKSIRALRSCGFTLRELAEQFGGSKDAIHRVVGPRS